MWKKPDSLSGFVVFRKTYLLGAPWLMYFVRRVTATSPCVSY